MRRALRQVAQVHPCRHLRRDDQDEDAALALRRRPPLRQQRDQRMTGLRRLLQRLGKGRQGAKALTEPCWLAVELPLPGTARPLAPLERPLRGTTTRRRPNWRPRRRS